MISRKPGISLPIKFIVRRVTRVDQYDFEEGRDFTLNKNPLALMVKPGPAAVVNFRHDSIPFSAYRSRKNGCTRP
jgi:hypothetical protein